MVENAVGAHLYNSGDPALLSYWRKGKMEVDFVLSRGQRIAAIEVKSGRARSMPGLTRLRRDLPRVHAPCRRRGRHPSGRVSFQARRTLDVAVVNTTVPRTCTEIGPGGERIPGLTLTTQRDRPAYVLLGEPGAGKTTAFAEEARAAGCEAVSARDFVVFDRPEWRNWTLFIDGLDEIRAGSTNSHTPLDAIRRKIDALGRPPFRISCREADWHGAGDRDSLDRIAPGGRVAILHLDDLDTGQIETLLRENHGEPDPKGFIDCARQRRLDSLLGNPQNLRMLAEAVRQGWPDGLAETYALACQRLAEESNRGHRDAWRQTGIATDDVLFAAGHGCAVQLLAGVAGFALDPAVADKNHPAFDAIGLTGTPALNRALGSRLFESRTRNEQREPAHRSIAEYLGARFLASESNARECPWAGCWP
jgi:hypothetical protein